MKKTIFIIVVLWCFLFSAVSCQNKKSADSSTASNQSVSNLKPMYGKGKKTKEQLASDQKFLKACDSIYSSRQEAAIAHINFGWYYMENDDLETAMKRFNQAWLLDSLNAEVYWGFGVLVGNDGNNKESLTLFEKAVQLDPENPILWFWMALNSHKLYTETNENKYNDQIEEYLQKAEKLDPKTDFRGRLNGTEIDSDDENDTDYIETIEIPSLE